MNMLLESLEIFWKNLDKFILLPRYLSLFTHTHSHMCRCGAQCGKCVQSPMCEKCVSDVCVGGGEEVGCMLRVGRASFHVQTLPICADSQCQRQYFYSVTDCP